MRRPIHILAVLLAIAWLSGCAPNTSSTTEKPAEASDHPGPADIAELPGEPKGSASSDFWDHWGDGKGELSGYRGEMSRYGELRDAEVVLIYVTEPMSRKTWIKDDRAEGEERVNVLKLNHTANFRTGVYPYSVMTSVFSPVDDWGRSRFQPTKISLTSQEWCGHVFHGIWPGPDRFLSEMHSYFAEEGDTTKVQKTPEDTLYEDALFIQLRELDGPFAGGGDWQGHLVPRLWERRKAHNEVDAVAAKIERTDATLEGTPVTRFVLTYHDQRVVFDVENAHPRRVLRWTRSDGSHLRLQKTARLPYWQLNAPGGERHLNALGLGGQDTDGQ